MEKDNSIEKPKQKKGFALKKNKKNINREGRPSGSRNRSKIIAAQLKIDDTALASVDFLKALMSGDKELLGLTDGKEIPLSLRLKAAESLLNKGIANEKTKEAAYFEKSTKDKPNSNDDDDDDDEDDGIPEFSSTAVQ